MSSRRAIGIAVSSGLLAAAGLLTCGTPANASASLYCDPITSGGTNYAVCSLDGAASPANSKWTFDGNYLSAYDNQTYVRLACGGTGSRWTVAVTYTDSSGAPGSASAWGTCGGIAQ